MPSAKSIGEVLAAAEALVVPDLAFRGVGPRLADALGVPRPHAVEVLHCRLDVPRRADRAAAARLEIGWHFVTAAADPPSDVFAVVNFDGSVAPIGGGAVVLPDLGIVAWSFPPDPRIPGASEVLAGPEAEPGETRVVSYGPLRGCTVWHRAHEGLGPEPIECYGKAWADPAKATNARLAADAVRGAVPIPGQLAVSRERATMWTEALPGRTLRAPPSELEATAHALAATLAAVHGTDITGLPVIATDEIIKRARNKLDRLGFLVPVAGVVRRVAQRLGRLAADVTGLEPTLTLMGDCHGGQFVVGDGVVSVVDLDSFARSSPERDLAEFVASIVDGPDRWRGGVAEFAEVTLGAYERASGYRIDRHRLECVLIAERIARIYRVAQSLAPGWRDEVSAALEALANERREF